MVIDDNIIGTAGDDDTSLLCITNLPPSGGNSGGNWVGSNGENVRNNGNVPGFRRNRDSMVVRLYRSTISTETPIEGIYQCQIDDAAGTPQMLYVGLYFTGGGKYVHLLAVA